MTEKEHLIPKMHEAPAALAQGIHVCKDGRTPGGEVVPPNCGVALWVDDLEANVVYFFRDRHEAEMVVEQIQHAMRQTWPQGAG